MSTYVIAEIGVNHDGVLARALELVEHARAAGANAVKLQLFRAHTLMHASSAFATYQAGRVADATPADMLRRYELSPSDVTTLVEAIRAAGLDPIATPFSPRDLAQIAELNLPAIKIASPDLVNRPLLQAAAGLRKPLLLSTGAATMAEVAATVGWLRDWGAEFTLLHCVSSYPTPDDQANLCWIAELAGRFSCPVGYSDHTTDGLAGAFAVAAGATVIEKHLTYDRAASGPDHSASADPAQLVDYVRAVRRADVLRGQGGKRVLPIEQDVRKVSRQSLVLTRDLAPGELISESDLTPQRPGTGIPAADVQKVTGRSVAMALRAGTLLDWEMLAA
ncbi:MAG TPA: N-acetylneuraminate synthase family protein [Tepidisphaeraceae bacterium]|nr:N-acetylneuraminate synthase family protein [Tepidisphaeraceae bacterium]